MSEKLEEFLWKFQSKDKKTNKLRNYVIKRVPEDRFEEVKEFMIQYFLPDEAMNECKKTAQNDEAVKASRVFMTKHLEENCSLICFEENSNEIAGVNLMTIHTKQEVDNKKDDEPECEAFADIGSVFKIVYSQFQPCEYYKVNNYLDCNGIAIHKHHRGNGIATEFFKARVPLMKILDLTLTSAGCTGVGSQIAAERAGYERNFSIRYDELHKHQKDLYFHGIKHEYFQVFSCKI